MDTVENDLQFIGSNLTFINKLVHSSSPSWPWVNQLPGLTVPIYPIYLPIWMCQSSNLLSCRVLSHCHFSKHEKTVLSALSIKRNIMIQWASLWQCQIIGVQNSGFGLSRQPNQNTSLGSILDHALASVVCFFMCLFKLSDRLQEKLHFLQANGFSPVWTSLWCIRWLDWRKEKLHWSHTKGFSPLCCRMCVLRLLAQLHE